MRYFLGILVIASTIFMVASFVAWNKQETLPSSSYTDYWIEPGSGLLKGLGYRVVFGGKVTGYIFDDGSDIGDGGVALQIEHQILNPDESILPSGSEYSTKELTIDPNLLTESTRFLIFNDSTGELETTDSFTFGERISEQNLIEVFVRGSLNVDQVFESIDYVYFI